MKHDEKKIEEILKKNNFFRTGSSHSIDSERSMKQYAEHMLQQERERITGICYGAVTMSTRDGVGIWTPEYKTVEKIINLINKEDE